MIADRTSSGLMSSLGHKRTFRSVKQDLLFDHFVGALLKLQGHLEAQRFGGLEVYHQFEQTGRK